ncbi:MAG: 50S ribosomal protein L2 [Candidatus Methylacidiphilales bacterium]
MALKTFKANTPSLRYTELLDNSDLTTDRPEKSLLRPLKKSGGRNNNGRVTARHRGGGHKRKYRVIDWKRNRRDEEAEVISIEYDPNRTARIALVEYPDKERRYIVAPDKLQVGDKVQSGENAPPKVGNCLPLKAIPVGIEIHNLELIPGRGAQMVRSAGSAARSMGFTGEYAQVKLPSGEIRQVHRDCCAVIGQVSNLQHENISLGKAGRARWKGRRPHVRGMAMNPVDHPNGGGEGRSKSGGGRQHLSSPWGQVARGLKTRRKHKSSSRFIVERRKK